jgi:LDH2 family malate/lactate/ureidoglycolate dehydrogenase
MVSERECLVSIGSILRNNVKEKLARDQVVASMTVRLVRSIEIARIAASAGFDTLYVDGEHSSFSLETTGAICMAALAAGIAPFVRVPANTADYISRVLDGGALGVIAPHVGSAEEARAVVRAAKYPPLGDRSNAGALPHLHFRSFPAAEANAAINDATMVIVQLESAAALDRRGRGRRPGADRAQRPIGGLGHPRPVRRSAGARSLCADHRRLPQARQALRGRRARIAARPRRRARAHGRPLRLDRHRPCLPARRLHRKGARGAGDQAVTASPRPTKTERVYADAAAADAFARRLLLAHGVPEADAAVVAGCLVSADLRGVDTHGLTRLPGYLDRLRRGLINPRPALQPKRVTPVAATLDGENGFGFVVGTRAMQEAIAIACEFGIGVVSVRRSTHFGMAASYVLQALDAGLISLVFSNASPAMPPWGARTALLGTNPLAAGAPAGREPPFLLDMSPAVAARGKIRRAERRGEAIPLGYALDAEGHPTTDPKAALGGVVLPIGGYKGSGLAMLIDILGGVISGAKFGGEVGDQYKVYDRPQDVGHFLLAMRPDLFVTGDDYRARMDTLLARVRASPTAEGVDEVLIPGDPERRCEETRCRTGIPYSAGEVTALRAEAAKAGVAPLAVSDRIPGA